MSRSPRFFKIKRPDFNFETSRETEQRIQNSLEKANKNEEEVQLAQTNVFLNSSSKPSFLQKPSIKRFILSTNIPKLRSRNNSPSPSNLEEIKEERKTSVRIEHNDLAGIKQSILQITKPKFLIRKRSLSPLQVPPERKQIEKMPLELFDLQDDNDNFSNLKKNQPAFSPYYEKGEYVLKPVKIIEYQENNKKFTVVNQENKQKIVSRIGIRFPNEKIRDFKNRVDESKILRAEYEERIRFNHYIDNMDATNIEVLPEETKFRIVEKLSLNKESSNNFLLSHFLKILIDEANETFIKSGKIFMCYEEMKKEENRAKFEELQIKIRERKTFYPEFGCILKSPVFKFYSKQLRSALMNRTVAINEISILLNRDPSEFLKQTFIKINFEEKLPLEITELDNILKKYHIQSRLQLQKLWRQNIIEEIHRKLIKFFNFFEVEARNYFGSDLERLLTKFNLLLSSTLCSFLSSSLSSYLSYLSSSSSLLLLTIEVSKKSSSTFFHLTPPKDLIKAVLISPIQMAIETVLTLKKIDKPLLPLINIWEKNILGEGRERREEVRRREEVCRKDTGGERKEGEKLKEMEGKKEEEVIKEGRMKKDGGGTRVVGGRGRREGEGIEEEEVRNMVENGWKEAEEVMEKVKRFEFVVKGGSKKMIEQVFEMEEKEMLDKIRGQLADFYQAIYEIPKISVPTGRKRLLHLDILKLKEYLISKSKKNMEGILKRLDIFFKQKIENCLNSFETMNKSLLLIPENERNLLELRDEIHKSTGFLEKMKESDQFLKKIVTVFEDFLFEVDNKNFELYYYLKSWPTEILHTLQIARKNSGIAESKFIETLLIEKKEFASEITSLFEKFESIRKYNNFKYIKEESMEVNLLKEKIEKTLEHAKSIAFKEETLHLPISSYSDLMGLSTDFEPFNKMWEIVLDLDIERQEWFNGSFLKLNYLHIERKMEFFFKESLKLQKTFNEKQEESATKIIRALREDIEKLRGKLWIVECLTNEAVLKKPSIWKDVFIECELSYIEPNNEMTLMILIDHGIAGYREKIEEITKRVEKQWNFEKKLGEMHDKLRSIKLEIVPYKKTNTYILKSSEEIQHLIEENLNTVLLMKASPYSKTITQKVKDLENKLVLFQDTLENLIQLQKNWLYLEPIFASEDFQKNMMEEKKNFEKRDKNYRNLMENFARDASLWDNIDSERLKSELEEDNRSLSQIQKNLASYLETKRMAFPRFYFLSDEELLEILSHSKELAILQKHIGKCFEGANQLLIEEDIQIKSLFSPERETLMLKKQVKITGKVEQWLSKLEKNIFKTMDQILIESEIDLKTSERINWLFKWPGQVVLVINSLDWTRKIEMRLIDNAKLNEFYNESSKHLINIVDSVRSDHSKLQRQTLESLVTIDVHNRDVLEELIKQNVVKSSDFFWQAQMRYYMSSNTPLSVHMIYASRTYGFEYLGNTTRLVITPLTARCFRTLFSAYYLSYGGGPEGPAGTGKTESVKDLAKATGTFCLVFNCSESLNYHSVFKLLKGVSATGGFICFDEFNRIQSEVLSVVAQQILAIQNAIRERKGNFMFEEEKITINIGCCINITMNPNYAGRSKLPENLKSLFRTCAMMMPDYNMIAEIYLFSVGFHNARDLSRKMVSSLLLCSQQLSVQEHYDFGMRTLKTILVAAGEIKRKGGEKEEEVVMKAIVEINLPKFNSNDIPLFDNIISDLFQMETRVERKEELEQMVGKAAESLGLVDEGNITEKCIQLFNTLSVRHGIMLIGSAFTGKTNTLLLLQHALQLLPPYLPTLIFRINPKSIPLSSLYGHFEEETKTWEDGILSNLIRGFDNKQRNWIIFDGPVDSFWVENLNTVLDDNKKLCLANGEIVRLNNLTALFFEVEHLHYASPATVSRCGMVFLEADHLNEKVLIKAFGKKIKENIYLENFLMEIIPKLMQYFNQLEKAMFLYEMKDLFALKTFFEIIKSITSTSDLNEKEIVARNLVFALFWGFGSMLTNDGRGLLSVFLVNLLKDYNIETVDPNGVVLINNEHLSFVGNLPNDGKIGDYFLDKNSWKLWSAQIEQLTISKLIDYNHLIVPNIDFIRLCFFLHLGISSGKPIIICGPTGIGKSMFINAELKKKYGGQNSEYTVCDYNMFGHSTSLQIQKLLENKINIRRRRNVYSPEEGKKVIFFLDDLNLPEPEPTGAHPCLELIRQQLDLGGIYDLETMEFKLLYDALFVGSFTTGNTTFSNRFLRHFQMICFESIDEENINRIFTHICEWVLMNIGIVSKNIRSMREKIVKASVWIFLEIKKTNNFKPIPSKSHYIFSLRDLSKLFGGLLKINVKSIGKEEDFLKIWLYESERVYEDRLISTEDVKAFKYILHTSFIDFFPGKGSMKLITQATPILFTINTLTGQYSEIKDVNDFKKSCEEVLREKSSAPALILFLDALQHILRIQRSLVSKNGHILLIGVGGSGRKSLSALATNMMGWGMLSLERMGWEEEKKKVLGRLAEESKGVVVFAREEEIQKQKELEEVCCLLKGGDVANILSNEERILVVDHLQGQDASGSIQNRMDTLNRKVKNYLHFIISLSSSGEILKKKIRLFPALLHHTTLDWFRPWPEDALKLTAEIFLKERQNDTSFTYNTITTADDLLRRSVFSELSPKLHPKIIEIWLRMYKDIQILSERFWRELRTPYYVTPNLFLDCLSIFQRILVSRGEKMSKLTEKYEIGLEKLKQTEDEVYRMHKILEDLRPKLAKLSMENNEMLNNLQTKQLEADEKLKFCEMEEQETAIQKNKSDELRSECKIELDRVLPLLHAAAQALNKISKDDLTKIRSYTNPPKAVDIVIQGICYLLEEDVNVKWKKGEGEGEEKVQDFWEYAKRKMLNDKLIKKIQMFKEEKIRRISKERLAKLYQIINMHEFEKERVFKSSTAAGNLSIWIRTVLQTYEALKIVDPKKMELQQAETKYKKTVALLKEKKRALSAILGLIKDLEKEYELAKVEQQNLQNQVTECEVQLQRAEQLMLGLAVEKESWKKKGVQCSDDSKTLVGDSLLSSAIIAFLGIFPPFYRDHAVNLWKTLLKENQIHFLSNFCLKSILSDPIKNARLVNEEHLPNDEFSIDNALIVENSEHWPLLIDPQRQAIGWIREKEKENKLLIVRNGNSWSEIVFNFENALQFGLPMLFENLGEEIDNIFMPLIQLKRFQKKSKDRQKVLVGAKYVEMSPDFRIYFACKLSRPSFSPEICVNVTFLNFNVTKEALEDQMLNIVVRREEPEKEDQRQNNLKEFIENRDKLRQTENEILLLITESKNEILKDEALIDVLNRSKNQSALLEERLAKAEIDQENLEKIRNLYKDAARRVSNLFFILAELASIECMYQFSMEFHINLYHQAINNSAREQKNHRINAITQNFTALFYENINRSLLEHHKIIFSFLIVLRIMQYETNKASANEIRFFMLGGTAPEKTTPKELKNIITSKQWGVINELSQNLEVFQGFADDCKRLGKEFGRYFSNFKEVLPLPWSTKISAFQKLILVRILHPEKLISYIQNMIIEELGRKFIESTPFNLHQAYSDSSPTTPIILILSPGVDPLGDLGQLCEKISNKGNLYVRALGQGQNEISTLILKKAMKEGKWLFLQNCHLSSSWLLTLEKLLEEDAHKDFRLWLSSMPIRSFPIGLLEKGIKMSFEPARGLKNNLLLTYFTHESHLNNILNAHMEEKMMSTNPYNSFTGVHEQSSPTENKATISNQYISSHHPILSPNFSLDSFKKTLFSLAFFHGVLIERKRFGGLGWNVAYEFSQSDFEISSINLQFFFSEERINWEAINYVIGEMNYGGRVTDALDQRIIKVVLKEFMREEVLEREFKFSESGVYFIPEKITNFKKYVASLPINDLPEVFGLHENAEISCSISEANYLCQTILDLLPNNASESNVSIEELVKEKSLSFISTLPIPFDLSSIYMNYPLKYENSMNSVLIQELAKFNKLINLIKSVFEQIIKAIEGSILMTNSIEETIIEIYDNKLPSIIRNVSYDSVKPLGSWMADFLERITFMRQWVEDGCPKEMWLSGLYYPHAFLTGILQNFSRKHRISIETLQFKFEINPNQVIADGTESFLIYGLYLEGAVLNINNRNTLIDAPFGCLIFEMPKILFKVHMKIKSKEEKDIYECPLYRTSVRAGNLSTIGRSTNYLLSIDLPMVQEDKVEKWVKRGVALITQNND